MENSQIAVRQLLLRTKPFQTKHKWDVVGGVLLLWFFFFLWGVGGWGDVCF